MGTILDQIMAHKVEEVAIAKIQISEAMLRSQLHDAPPPRDFLAALQRDTITLIAEVKKASPSKGIFVADFDPVQIASIYASNGASAISVITDEQFFQGHLDFLKQVRQAVSLPVLRKEFILDPYQVLESRVAGADAILLIVACLEPSLLTDLHAIARDLGMAVLVEVHDEDELERALKLNPHLIGINNRNLHDFSVNLETTVRLAAMMPKDITIVGESGIHAAEDIKRLKGIHAVLVGESLILAENRAAKIRELSGVCR